jgi:hypothetical protein
MRDIMMRTIGHENPKRPERLGLKPISDMRLRNHCPKYSGDAASVKMHSVPLSLPLFASVKKEFVRVGRVLGGKKPLSFRFLCSFAAASFFLTAAAADKSGVKPTSISLPSGPGSIEGLGESFEPQLNSSTFSYRVPLKLPPIRGGAPALALEYSSDAGNGPLGLGWQLKLPCVRRQTDKGLPRYVDGDLFIDVH